MNSKGTFLKPHYLLGVFFFSLSLSLPCSWLQDKSRRNCNTTQWPHHKKTQTNIKGIVQPKMKFRQFHPNLRTQSINWSVFTLALEKPPKRKDHFMAVVLKAGVCEVKPGGLWFSPLPRRLCFRSGLFACWFVCLIVSRIEQKPLARFSWNLVAGCNMGRGRNHQVLKQIRVTGRLEFSFASTNVAGYGVCPWWKPAIMP